MGENTTFRELIERLRVADEMAAREIITQYGAAVRTAVRVRLRDPLLRRVLDSTDVAQSVMGSFFVRIASGEYELETPRQLLALLTSMAHRKVLRQSRLHHQARRDVRRLASVDAGEIDQLVDPAAFAPPELAAGRELLERFRALLSPLDRYLAEQRVLGRSWPDLAGELKTTPDQLRMRFTRALDQAATLLDLD